MNENRESDCREIHSPVQLQSRRFACDRCRMQKLRCERDKWSSSLMSCKRCRRRNMICTISPQIDRTSIQKSRRRPGNPKVVTKAKQGDPKQIEIEMNSPADTVEQWPSMFPKAAESGIWGYAEQPTENQILIKPMLGDGTDSGLFSGLITPPSSTPDTDRESEVYYQFPCQQPRSQGCPTEHDSEKSRVSYYKSVACVGEHGFQKGRLENEECYFDATENRVQNPTERLLELHSFLLKESKRITSHVTEDFQYSLSTLHPVDSMHGNPTSLDAAVHTALSLSGQFLDILKHFNLQAPPDSQPLPFHVATNPPRAYQETLLAASLRTLATTFEGYETLHGTDNFAYNLENQHNGLLSKEHLTGPDIPTALTLVSCYICLLQVYYAIFTCVVESLVGCVSMNGHLNSTMPGLSPSGAPTNGIDIHRALQLQMLIRVSTHLLTLIEEQLGLSESQCVERPGVLNNVSPILLDSLSKYEGATLRNRRDSLKKSLEQTIEAINQFLEWS